MKTSENHSNVLTAVVKLQSSIGTIAKGSQNPFFKSKYTALPQILDVLNPLLVEHKLGLFQPVKDGKIHVLFIHESGEWVEFEGTRVISAKENDPQAMGSAISYARRYSLSSVLCINSDGDDDGEKAMNRTQYKQIKQDLKAGTEMWNKVVKAVRENKATPDMIREKFNISKSELSELLIDANSMV